MDEVEQPRDEPNWVRPYTLTGGRTDPGMPIPLEAQIVLTDVESPGDVNMDEVRGESREAIVEMCVDRPSVAEIASRLDLPLGVARVLVADLVISGYLRVSSTLDDQSSVEDRRELIGRTLRGLRKL